MRDRLPDLLHELLDKEHSRGGDGASSGARIVAPSSRCW
jgi:hypothetical protein